MRWFEFFSCNKCFLSIFLTLYALLSSLSYFFQNEGEVAWASPGTFTVHNFPCSEDGKNCVSKKPAVETQVYVDPALDIIGTKRRLATIKQQNDLKSLRA